APTPASLRDAPGGAPSAAPSAGPPAQEVSRPPPSAENVRARKEALARRLMAGRAPMQASRAPPTPSTMPKEQGPPTAMSTEDAMAALKQRFDDRIESAAQAQARRHAADAETAFDRRDFVSASTAYTFAVRFAPQDATLAARAKEVKERADVFLSESY